MKAAESLGNDKHTPENGFTALMEWIHVHFLWLLVGCYVLAAFLPGPGLMIRRLSWGNPYAGEVTTPMLLLAMLLFCAAAVLRWEQVWQLMLQTEHFAHGSCMHLVGAESLCRGYGMDSPASTRRGNHEWFACRSWR